ncbi:MAG: hypothetical protein MR836_09480 [Ruminococcus sp.]|nr:hypothetical protein [Ruminococcus sp.]
MSYGIPIKVMSENLGHANTGVTIPVPNSNTKPVAVHTDKQYSGVTSSLK